MAKKEGFKMKVSPWTISTLILLIILAVFLFAAPWELTGKAVAPTVSAEEAANKAVEYINKYLLQGQATAVLESVKEENGLYNVKISIAGRTYDSYITMDGRLLFPSAVDLTETLEIPEEPLTPTQQPETEVSADDDPFLGPEDADITVIEFSDFQCPFCAAVMGLHPDLISRFKASDSTWEPAVPKLKELAEQGKIKFVFRDYPLSIHQNAQKAAEASECADEQGKFWEYHDKLFENQQALDVESLKQYAADLGLDTEKFNNCLDNDEMGTEVQKDFQDGLNYGVEGTPAFFINGQLVSGAQSFSVFKQIIDVLSE